MTAGQVLEQFSNLVKHMEAIGPKLSSNIRPNKDQLKEFQTLGTKLKTATATIETHVEHLLQGAARRAAPNDKDLRLLDRLRSSESVSHLNSSVAITLRNNLCLIFQGPDVSLLHSKEQKARREKTQARCEELRVMKHRLILAWASTLQPSEWKHPTGMAETTFKFLVKELEKMKFGPISPKIAETLQCLKEEEPLKNCILFHGLIDGVAGATAGHHSLDTDAPPPPSPSPQPSQVMTAEHQQQDVVPIKRKYTAESTTSGGNSCEYDDHRQEQINLIKRSKEIDYKGSSIPANNLQRLIHRLPAAIGDGKQWKWERQFFKDNVMRSGHVGIDRTDCLNIFVPKDSNRDISITLMVGYRAGMELIYEAGVELIHA